LGGFALNDFEVFPEMSGEPVNDAVQARLIAMDELYNCTIIPIYSATMITDARKEILANGDTYDLIMPALTEGSSLAGEGLLIDLFTVNNIHLEMPWWSIEASKNLSLMNKLYYTLSDIVLGDKNGLGALIFSKKLVEDNNLTSPYQLVYDNKWTLDVFFDMCKGMCRDINGDGILDKEDQFGYLGDNNQIVSFMYYCEINLVKKDKNDIPYPSIDNEHVINVVDKVLAFYADTTSYGKTSIFGGHVDANKPFMNNQILFRGTSMLRTTQIREMESDFGFIVPPKYTESQEKYYNVYSYGSPGVAIPISVKDPEENGAITEALAYYGRLMLLPAFYEINLQTKITRDEDSPVMLDMMFESATVDLGYVYNFGDIRDMFTKIADSGVNNFASVYASNEPKILSEIENLVDMFS